MEIRVGRPNGLSKRRVSGCRLLCLGPDGGDAEGCGPSHLRVCDFNHEGRAKYLYTLGRASGGGGTR